MTDPGGASFWVDTRMASMRRRGFLSAVGLSLLAGCSGDGGNAGSGTTGSIESVEVTTFGGRNAPAVRVWYNFSTSGLPEEHRPQLVALDQSGTELESRDNYAESITLKLPLRYAVDGGDVTVEMRYDGTVLDSASTHVDGASIEISDLTADAGEDATGRGWTEISVTVSNPSEVPVHVTEMYATMEGETVQDDYMGTRPISSGFELYPTFEFETQFSKGENEVRIELDLRGGFSETFERTISLE